MSHADKYIFPPKEKAEKEPEPPAPQSKKKRTQFTRVPGEPYDAKAKNINFDFQQPENPKVLDIMFLGPSNVGKSTLLNTLVGQKVHAASSKPQTTRQVNYAVLNKDNVQVIIHDTPGAVHKKLEKNIHPHIITASWSALNNNSLDMIAVVLDLTSPLTRQRSPSAFTIFDRLAQSDTKAKKLLLLNKLDVVPREQREDTVHKFVSTLQNEYKQLFSGFVPISAQSNYNINVLLDTLLQTATPKPWRFPPGFVSPLSEVDRITEIIREKIYRRLNAEVPYSVTQFNLDWKQLSDGTLRIENVLCVRSVDHKKILIGKGASTISDITNWATIDIEKILGRKVHLALTVQLKNADHSA